MYVSCEEMVARFGEREMQQLTDRDASVGEVVEDVLDAALTDATAEVDSYLSVRYQLPLASVPDVVRSITADITRYRLYDTEIPEIVEKRYDSAVRFLRDVAARRASLDKDAVGNAPPIDNGVQHVNPGRVFTSDALEGY